MSEAPVAPRTLLGGAPSRGARQVPCILMTNKVGPEGENVAPGRRDRAGICHDDHFDSLHAISPIAPSVLCCTRIVYDGQLCAPLLCNRDTRVAHTQPKRLREWASHPSILKNCSGRWHLGKGWLQRMTIAREQPTLMTLAFARKSMLGGILVACLREGHLKEKREPAL